MLRAIRNFTKSRLGVIIVFIVLGVIALAFAAGDVTGFGSVTGGNRSNEIATVGSTRITDAEVRDTINRALDRMRAGGQPVTTEQFLASGQYEAVIAELIDNAARVEYAKKHGMTVSTALLDGEIASAPVFQGVDGKFDQKKLDAWLVEQRFSIAGLRDDLLGARYSAWLLEPIVAAAQVPNQLVTPYAAFQVQRRKGMFGMVGWNDMPKPTEPDDKALSAYYATNRSRYMIPERRVIRYAVVKADEVKARSAPTDAEIAEAYKKAGPRFAATEKRSVRQLVVADQAAANKVAAEVKAGKSIEDQARSLGLDAAKFDGLEKEAFARQTSAPIADAVFAAAQGSVIGPIRSQIGWAVLQVDKVEVIAAKSLEQARAELVPELTDRKTIAALGELRQKIEDGIGDSSTFDELMKIGNLAPLSLGPVAANGTNPLDPNIKLDPALAPVVRGGFATQPDDDQQMVAMGQDGSFAVVAPQQVIASAPRPLAEIRKQVFDEYLVDEALKKARAAAADIIKQINAGTPFAQAMAAHGPFKAPSASFDVRRVDFEGKPMPPHVNLAFSTATRKAKFIAAPNRAGYLIIYVDSIEEADPSGNAELVAAMRTALLRVVPQEHGQQFMEAVRREVKVKRNDAVIARLKAEYAQSGGRAGS